MGRIKKIKNSKLKIFIVLLSILTFINLSFLPTPKYKRNISKTDVKIKVKINDKNETRSPIIRTYKKENYKKFSGFRVERIMNAISGKVEGDIPAIYLKNDKNIIYVSFIKNGQEILPDYTPEIKIEVPKDESTYNTKNSRIIKDKLKDEEGIYSYKLKRYIYQYEKYFMHYNIVRINYEIDGEEYISILGLNTTNVGEEDSFFENEVLQHPKAPEN